MKTFSSNILVICAALAAPLSFAAEPVVPCDPVRSADASKQSSQRYRVSVSIFDQESKGLKTNFEVLVDGGGAVVPVKVADEISRANSEPVVVGTFASLQAVPKGQEEVLRVCARIANLADQSAAAALKVNESNAVLEMPLRVGEVSRSMIGSHEMVVRVAKIDR